MKNQNSTKNNQDVIVLKPVDIPPRRKLYLYALRLCQVCGSLHYYRKTADFDKENVVYGCLPNYQMALLGDQATIKQPSLF